MATKVGLKRMKAVTNKKRKLELTNHTPRKTVSNRAPSADLKCPMQIKIFVGTNNKIYLSTNSNLRHCHHPYLKSEAILRGQRDLEDYNIDLITLLNDVNVPPTQIVHIMEELKGTHCGTYRPKRIYDMSQKVEDNKDFANVLLPECNDAHKTIAKLEASNINHFYIVHDDTGLYAVSKGRPTKEAVRLRLDCSVKIQADLECLREDYIVNDKSKLLVMVSMATDEMIRLVAMYPEVWFMDTTAGEFLYQFIR